MTHPATCPSARRAGFTLIEVMLALTLTIALMAAVLAFYQHVVDVREDFTGQLSAVQATAARRRVMDRITDELRGAIVFSFLNMGLSGGPTQMRFTTAVLPGRSVWVTEEDSLLGEPPAPQHDIRQVGYRLRMVEDEYGEEVVVGLERTVQEVLTAEVAEEGEQIRAGLIAPQFKFVSFRYWDNQAGEWLESWEGGDLPLAVEVSLGAQPLPEEMEPADYPFETVRRIVYVPGGLKAFGGSTIIRGLRGRGRGR